MLRYKGDERIVLAQNYAWLVVNEAYYGEVVIIIVSLQMLHTIDDYSICLTLHTPEDPHNE